MSYTQGTWNTGEQIRDHKLACSIINLHKTEDEVFDEPSLSDLKSFVERRSVAHRDAWMEERGLDSENAATKGSLTGYIISRYGTADSALDERDWELLDDWFKNDMPTGQNVSH